VEAVNRSPCISFVWYRGLSLVVFVLFTSFDIVFIGLVCLLASLVSHDTGEVLVRKLNDVSFHVAMRVSGIRAYLYCVSKRADYVSQVCILELSES